MRSLSCQACPNWSREYPVFGARPFTVSVATAASAVPFDAFTGATVGFVGDGVGVGVAVSVGEGDAVGVGVALGVGVVLEVTSECDGTDEGAGAAVGASSVGVVVVPPTGVRASASANAPPAAALLLRRAQARRPRTNAMTATTNMYAPEKPKKPPIPDSAAPMTATSARPPHPSQLATDDPPESHF